MVGVFWQERTNKEGPRREDGPVKAMKQGCSHAVCRWWVDSLAWSGGFVLKITVNNRKEGVGEDLKCQAKELGLYVTGRKEH